MSIDKLTPKQWDEARRIINTLGPGVDMYEEDKCNFGGDTEEEVEERLRDEDKASEALDNIEKDLVNHPPHYNNGGVECIEYIKQQLGPEGFRSYLEGSIIKYIHRFKFKNQNIRDLEKSVWYTNRLIEELKNM